MAREHIGARARGRDAVGHVYDVKRQSQRDAAFDVVSQIAGVGGITDRIEVVTAGLGG